jgi:hypothetical protein
MRVAKDALMGNPIGTERMPKMKKKPSFRMRISMDRVMMDGDEKYRKERRERDKSYVQALEKHPALKDDNEAIKMSRDAIANEIKTRKAEIDLDEARGY